MSDHHDCTVCPCPVPRSTHCPCLHAAVEPVTVLALPERQVWERRVGGTDIAEVRLHLDVDHEGRARVHEAVLAQLLVDAGWERTA